MNIKDILLPLSFALLLTFGLQYFFGPKVQQGGIPAQPKEIKSLLKEVSFIDQTAKPEEITEIKTSYGRLEFSSYGAALKNVEYMHHVDGKTIPLTTIVSPADYERDRNFFLIALSTPEQTPYYYTLMDQTEEPCITKLTYQATVRAGVIEKVFTINKDTYLIDVTLTLKPRSGESMQARVFFPTPLLQSASRSEHIAGLVEERNQSIVKYRQSRQLNTLMENYWETPSLIGIEDRYFAHALYNDNNNFIQRGYFKVDSGLLLAIVEGPEVTTQTTWKLSFFVGPKEHKALVAADPRLEELLDYGWLGMLAKPMLAFMKWINSYIHNFGFAIIIFTLLIRLLLLPLTLRGAKSGEKARELQKKIQYIKQKYKDDREAFEREQAELMQKYGMAGLGGLLGGGCLPVILQMPIFFAMNRVLTSSIELYQAPFLWISDLSGQDPFYILPLLVALSMLITTLSMADTQQRVSGFVMAALFGAFSVGFSAGLSLYICVSTLIGALQMYLQKMFKIA